RRFFSCSLPSINVSVQLSNGNVVSFSTGIFNNVLHCFMRFVQLLDCKKQLVIASFSFPVVIAPSARNLFLCAASVCSHSIKKGNGSSFETGSSIKSIFHLIFSPVEVIRSA